MRLIAAALLVSAFASAASAQAGDARDRALTVFRDVEWTGNGMHTPAGSFVPCANQWWLDSRVRGSRRSSRTSSTSHAGVRIANDARKGATPHSAHRQRASSPG